MTHQTASWGVITALSSVMALRLIGLFMVLPFFSGYALQLSGATPLWVGMAMGIYGLTQAGFQIPFGMWSDHVDRRYVMLCGLALFVVASLWAAEAHNITTLICARALQGSAAIGSVGLALMADLTLPEDRSKAMAVLGMSVGGAFFLAFMLGPLLHQWFGVPSLFLISASLGVLAIIILMSCVPTPKSHVAIKMDQMRTIIFDMRLNFFQGSAFLLHIILVAVFFVLPLMLQDKSIASASTWHLYLPAMCLSILFVLPGLRHRAQSYSIMSVFFVSLGALFFAPVIWLVTLNMHSRFYIVLGLICFFAGATLLEAWLPAWVSQHAPPSRRGMALGIQSSAQFLGMFVGSIFAGSLYAHFHVAGVLLGLSVVVLLWLVCLCLGRSQMARIS